jgi:hypothetical protein
MKISLRWLSLLAFLVLASGCATVSYPAGEHVERINWREYMDC